MPFIHFDTTLLYVKDVAGLKQFYCAALGFEVLEEITNEWALLKAGNGKLGLHKMGEQYLTQTSILTGEESNCKLILDASEDIQVLRQKLIESGASMREIKNFSDYPYTVCDGQDPEGNVFQIRNRK